jgi:hypothetical protein
MSSHLAGKVSSEFVCKSARVREDQVVVNVRADNDDAQSIVAVFMDAMFRQTWPSDA